MNFVTKTDLFSNPFLEEIIMTAIHVDPSKRHDFILVYDCQDGNPNGDPDADNMPRTDPETQHGIVTGVCIKRKIRNYFQAWGPTWENPERYNLYVKEGAVLNDVHLSSYQALGIPPVKKGDKDKKDKNERIEKSCKWLCDYAVDIRLFGAVMGTEINSGTVHGPIQIEFGRSYDPVFPMVAQLTRCAVTNSRDEDKERTFGRRTWIPYGLYRQYGSYTSIRGQQTGVTEADLTHFWEALRNMWDYDRSASRGMMALQKLIIFSHDHPQGNALAHQLFKRFSVEKNPDVIPRKFEDYQVHLNRDEVPPGITITELV